MLRQLLFNLLSGKTPLFNKKPSRLLSAEELDVRLHSAFQFHQAGQCEQAELLYEEILDSDTSNVNALHLLGLVKHLQNKNEEAIFLLEKALSVDPSFLGAQANLAVILRSVGRYDESLAYFNNVLMSEPNNLEALYNRGNLLLDMRNPQAAINDFNQYLHTKKDNADVYSSKATALNELGYYEESLACYDQAIQLNNNNAKYYLEKGNLLRELQHYDEAIECYSCAVAINPDYAIAHNNKAMALLSMHNFQQGWDLYEWRSKLENINLHPIKIAKGWDGKKSVSSMLVMPEQGLGDEIFYSGMLNDLEPFVNKITVCVDPRLISLYQRSFPHIEFISKELMPTAQNYEVQIYMASLGRYFRTSEQEIIEKIKSPYLKACPQKKKYFRECLSVNKKLICGLSWMSKNACFGSEKTLQLDNLKSILTLPGIEFVDLQYGDTMEEQTVFFNKAGVKLKQIPDVDKMQDIDSLASLIDACDIVLTISNTTAHLAGALGKPVIIMLPYAKGLLWYWHKGNGSSVWYPTAKLFRQNKIGDWASVMHRVKPLLEAEIEDHQMMRFNASC